MADVRVTKAGIYVEVQEQAEAQVTIVGVYVEIVEDTGVRPMLRPKSVNKGKDLL